MIKSLLGTLLGAGLGAAVGHSQVLCVNGECAITGSWYGGAVVGGLVGMMLLGGAAGGTIARADTLAEPRSEDPPSSTDTPADRHA